MSLNPYVKQAGPYLVNQVPCPHFQMMVNLRAPRAGVLHTTEGSTTEGAEGVFHHHFAPHFTVGPDHLGKVKIDQLVPIGFIGAALEAHNELALVQIEVVGFSKAIPWFFDASTANALANLLVVLERDYGIPLSHPWGDDDWAAAGPNAHRNSRKFGGVAGWFGHQDIPNNSHWDPGHLQWSRLFALAKTLKTPAALPAPSAGLGFAAKGAPAHA